MWNKREKEVAQALLDEETAVLKQLEKHYRLALEDVKLSIRILQADEQTQSKVHRIKYQETIKKQLEGILEKLHNDTYRSIQQYLNDSYTHAFVGVMYDLHGQDVPVIAPIDQNAAVKAIQLDTKLSERKIHPSANGELVTLYESLGVDVDKLKGTIRSEITRGLSSGMKYDDIARNVSLVSKAPLARAKTIVRTEGHRIQQASQEDARQAAVAHGADVVKQWDSTMDGDTRSAHRELDGQIREVNEPFTYGKKKAMFPGDFGDPAQDCNCRCTALTRARAALDADELATMKERAEAFGLSKEKEQSFKDFEKTYLKAADEVAEAPKFVPAKTIEEAEAYAERFVEKYKSKYTGNISYKGLDLDYANALNRAMTEVFDKYETKYPLRNIQPINFREKRFKDTTAEAAYQWGNRDLFYNQKYFKNKKTYDDHMKEIDDLMKTVLGSVDKLLAGNNLHPVKRRYLEALKKSGVQCVSQKTDDFVGATFIHEMGHYLDDEIFHKAITAKGIDLSASADKYAPGISGYATASRQEYIAESFTAFWYGHADLCDPDLVDIFKGAMKQ